MMNLPSKIKGYRSRAINALIDAVARYRPLPGPGLLATEGPGGTVLSLARPPASAQPPARPWDLSFYRSPEAGQSDWMVSVAYPVYVRGPVTVPTSVADARMNAYGSPAYIAAQIDLETGGASLLIAETIAGVTHAAVPVDGLYIRRLLYLAQSSADGCWIEVDYRGALELGVYG